MTHEESIERARAPQSGGVPARRGFRYQDHVATGLFIEMLRLNDNIIEVWCETVDDVTIVRAPAGKRAYELVQVKSDNLGSRWSVPSACSLVEKSLERDQYSEPPQFRIVTRIAVNEELDVLTIPIAATARQPNERSLIDKFVEKLGDIKSPQGRDLTYWVSNCFWQITESEEALINKNLLTLNTILNDRRLQVNNFELQKIYERFVYIAEEKALAIDLVNVDEKKVRKDWLLDQLHLLHSDVHSRKTLRSLPFPINGNFQGRQTELSKVRGLLATARAVLIHGFGGVGKTQLALEYCHRYSADYGVLWWLDAGSEDTILLDLTELAQKLNIDKADDVTRSVEQCLTWLHNHDSWLLVFDNIVDVSLLAKYIPSGTKGSCLITSQDAALDAFAAPLRLEAWSEADSLAFLVERTGLAITESTTELAQSLGGLPLALAQAAAYMANTKIDSAAYLERFKAASLRILDLPGPNLLYTKTVATTWLVSMESVLNTNPSASEILEWLSFFGSGSIPRDVFYVQSDSATEYLHESLKDTIGLDQALATLHRFSLVNLQPESVQIHPLVRLVIREQIPSQRRSERILESLGIILKRINCLDDHGLASDESKRLSPHLREILSYVDATMESDPLVFTARAALGACLTSTGDFAEAEPILRRIRAHYDGSGSPDELIAMNNLSVCLSKSGKLEEAEMVIRSTLELEEKLYGQNDPRLTRSLDNFSVLYMRKRDIDRARSFAQREYEILRDHQLLDTIDGAQAMHGLGSILVFTSQKPDGIKLLEKSLVLREELLGKDNIAVAATLCNLGDAYLSENQVDKALEVLIRAADIQKEINGIDHPDYAVTLMNLAKVQHYANRTDESERLMREALQISEAGLGPDSAQVANFTSSLASLYVEAQRFDEAEHLMQRVKQLAPKLGDLIADDLLSILNNEVIIALGRRQTLEAHSKNSEYIRQVEQSFGRLHPRHLNAVGRHIKILRRLRLSSQIGKYTSLLQVLFIESGHRQT